MALTIESDRAALHRLSKASMASGYVTTAYRLAKDKGEEPQIPSPEIFKSLADPQSPSLSTELSLPTVAECAVHLKLLEAFYVLRQRILRSALLDNAFGTQPIHEEVIRHDGTKVKKKDGTLWDRRQAKWPRFVELSVVRFLVWWRKGRQMFNQTSAGRIEVTERTLPPLDVLMVWHSFLLNPRMFRKFCEQRALHKLRFPWRSINQAISIHDWSFALTAEAAKKFGDDTGLKPDLFAQLEDWESLPSRTIEVLSTSIPGNSNTLLLDAALSGVPERFLFASSSPSDKTLVLQLRDAVIRQTSFIDKMNTHLWIRSPGLDGTLRRAISRYSLYLRLYKLYPTTMFVPTLDIDLAWHTHQCSASEYYNSTMEFAGKFLNHDDSIESKKLEDGFQKTKELYRIRFGKEYSICGCWDCEGLLSSLEDLGGNSAWDEKVDMDAITKGVLEDVRYYKAVELARRKQSQLPVRG